MGSKQKGRTCLPFNISLQNFLDAAFIHVKGFAVLEAGTGASSGTYRPSYGQKLMVITKNLISNAKWSSMSPVMILKMKWTYELLSESSRFARGWVFNCFWQNIRDKLLFPSLNNTKDKYLDKRKFVPWFSLVIYHPFELAVMLLAEKLHKSKGVCWIINQGTHPAKYIMALWSTWKNTFQIWRQKVRSALAPDWCWCRFWA